MSQREPHPSPPPEPQPPRRIRIVPLHWVGMLLMLTLPIAALFGWFDPQTQEQSGGDDVLEVRAKHPLRSRYGQPAVLEIRVRNRSPGALEQVTVSIDAQYLSGFNNLSITPPPRHAFVVHLEQVLPGETRMVSASLEGHAYGWREGVVRISAGDHAVQLPLRTFIFP